MPVMQRILSQDILPWVEGTCPLQGAEGKVVVRILGAVAVASDSLPAPTTTTNFIGSSPGEAVASPPCLLTETVDWIQQL